MTTLTKRARAIHERVMTLDTHNDISPSELHRRAQLHQDLGNQVNLPKMFKGGLDASFFIVYVGQDTARTHSRRPATIAPTSRRSRSSTPSIG